MKHVHRDRVVASATIALMILPVACSSRAGGAGDDEVGEVRSALGGGNRFNVPTVDLVPSRGYGELRTGANTKEAVLTPAVVQSPTFGKQFELPVDDQVYAQVLYVITSDLGYPTVFVATVNNSVYAFDADQGRLLWHQNFNNGFRAPTSAEVLGGAGCNNFSGNLGIVGTPIIDFVNGKSVMFFVAHTMENGSAVYRLWEIATLDGKPVVPPVVIRATAPGTGEGSVNGTLTLDAGFVNQRMGLAVSHPTTAGDNALYIGFGSYCDVDPYHGWLLAYDTKTMVQTGVFVSTPNGTKGGMWQSGGAPMIDSAGNPWVATGNGTYDGITNFGDSVVQLSQFSLQVLSHFTPSNQSFLEEKDLDLGAVGPSSYPFAGIVQGGKTGTIYNLDPNNPGSLLQQPLTLTRGCFDVDAGHCEEIHDIALWADSTGALDLFVWGEADNPRKFFAPNGATFSNVQVGTGNPLYPNPLSGGSLAVSSNGTSSPIVWATAGLGDPGGQTVPGIVYAFDENLHLLWNSITKPSDDAGAYAKFNPPTIANGKVYVPTFSNEVAVYGATNTFARTELEVEGTCMAVPASETSQDTPLEIFPCRASPSKARARASGQRWTLNPDGTIRSDLDSSKCVSLKGSSTASGTPIVLDACSGGAHQVWTYGSDGSLRGLGGQCIAVPLGTTTPRTKLQYASCRGSSSQRFTTVP